MNTHTSTFQKRLTQTVTRQQRNIIYRPVPVPIPIPILVPPGPSQQRRALIRLRSKLSDDDNPISREYCRKMKVFLYDLNEDTPIGEVTAYNKNTDSIRRIEHVADNFLILLGIVEEMLS